MNGAMADPWAMIMTIPKKRSTTIIGISHQSFCCQKKCRSSPEITNLSKTRRPAPMPSLSPTDLAFLPDQDEEAALPPFGEDPAELRQGVIQPRARVVPLEQPLLRVEPLAHVDLRHRIDVVDVVPAKPLQDFPHADLLLVWILVLVEKPDPLLLLLQEPLPHEEIEPHHPV